MNEVIEIGSASAKPGEIAEGNILVGNLGGGSEINIPITIAILTLFIAFIV